MDSEFKIIAMIPARYEASRFPGKLMKDLGGKTIIRRTFEAVKKTNLFEEVYVVTDSAIIAEEIDKNGGKVIKSKKDHQCGSDRIAEAAQQVDCDIVVNVQGDEPFISKKDLSRVVQVFNEGDAQKIDLASLMVPIENPKEIKDPNTVKVVVSPKNFALYFSRVPLPFRRSKKAKIPSYKHKGVYAFRKQALLDFYQLPMSPLEEAEKIECLRYLENGKNIKMAETVGTTVEIDSPQDLEKARNILKR